MKILQNTNYKDTSFSRKDLIKELKKENLRLCLVKDLRVGLKYIKISQNLIYSEIKRTNFYEHTIRNMVVSENSEKYLKYKKDIKKFCIDKELFIFAL